MLILRSCIIRGQKLVLTLGYPFGMVVTVSNKSFSIVFVYETEYININVFIVAVVKIPIDPFWIYVILYKDIVSSLLFKTKK